MKKYLIVAICLVIAGMIFFLIFYPLSQADGGFEQEQFLQDMEDIKAHFWENQALFQEIAAAFEEDDRIEMISPSDSGESEFDLRMKKETFLLSEVSPELYAALSALWSNEFHFLDFSRKNVNGCSAIYCYVTVNRYDIGFHHPTGTAVFLYFCENEPEKEMDSDYCEQLSDCCWLIAQTRELE